MESLKATISAVPTSITFQSEIVELSRIENTQPLQPVTPRL